MFRHYPVQDSNLGIVPIITLPRNNKFLFNTNVYSKRRSEFSIIK